MNDYDIRSIFEEMELELIASMRRNLTQEGLSEKLNVSRQTVSKWETDDAMPEMDKALELCKIFNCTLDNLFRDEMSVPDEKYSNLRRGMDRSDRSKGTRSAREIHMDRWTIL